MPVDDAQSQKQKKKLAKKCPNHMKTANFEFRITYIFKKLEIIYQC